MDRGEDGDRAVDGFVEDDDRAAGEASSLRGRSGQAEFLQYLQDIGAQYQRHLASLTEAQRRKEMAGVTFRPEISAEARARPARAGPIEDRLHNLGLRSQELRERERARSEQLRADAQRAEIDATRVPLTALAQEQKMRSAKSVPEATEEWIERHEQKLERLRDAALKRELAEVQPTPRINHVPGIEARRQGMSVEDYLLTRHEEARRAAAHRHDAAPVASAAGNTTRVSGTDVVSRLYNPHFKMPAYDPEFVEHCTFAPKTYSQYDDPLAALPPHLRVLERSAAAKKRRGPSPSPARPPMRVS